MSAIDDVGNYGGGSPRQRTRPRWSTNRDEARSAPSAFPPESSGQQTNLALPRFKTSFNVSLKQHFQALGITRAFDMMNADFSGMTGGQNAIYIDDVSHHAVIDLTEEGTEAAAAAYMLASGPRPFYVTRPFLFYIVDDATDAILFQGRIVDPR